MLALLGATAGQLAAPRLPQNVKLLGLTMKFADPMLNQDDPEIIRREVTIPRPRPADDGYEYAPTKHHVALSVRASKTEEQEDAEYAAEELADAEENGAASLLPSTVPPVATVAAAPAPDQSFLLPPIQSDVVSPGEDVECAWTGLPERPKPMQCGVLWFLHIAKTGGRDIITQLKGQALGPLAREQGGFVSARELPANWTFVELWYDRQMGASPMKSRRYQDTAAWKTMERALAEQEQPKVFVHDHNNMAGFDDDNMFDEVLRPMACALEARGCKLTLATMLREPNSRAKSHVFFEGGVTHDNFQQRMNSIGNYQTHYLLHNHNFHKIQKLEDADQTRASQILQHFELVGRTEDHDDFKDFVHTVMGVPSAPNENSDNNKTPDEQKLQLTQDEELVTKEQNLLDTKLFNGLCARDGESQRKILPLCTR